MGFFDLFRRKKEQKRTPAAIVEQAFKSKRISATLAEIEKVMGSVSKGIQYKTCLPEEMRLSYSAELAYAESGYIVFVSLALADGVGNVPQGILNTIFSLAVYYASASEIAKRKGFFDFAIKSGQRIALCDFVGLDIYGQASGHPIYGLFPDLINKTVRKPYSAL